MSNRNISKGFRGKKTRLSWLLTGAGAVAAVLFASMMLGSATAHAGEPPTPTATEVPPTDVPPTEVPPTATPTSDPVFTGTFDVTEADVCGGGTFALTLTSDGTGIVLLSVVDFIVSGSPNSNETSFEPPVDIAGDGSFFSEGPLPPPLEIVLSTFQGTFDFGVDPATVSGTLTIALVADPSAVLCEATFSGEQLPVGAEPPPPPPPAAADEPAPGLPATGTSGGTGSSSNGALWAMVAGIIGVVALGSAGVASLRRRQV